MSLEDQINEINADLAKCHLENDRVAEEKRKLEDEHAAVKKVIILHHVYRYITQLKTPVVNT